MPADAPAHVTPTTWRGCRASSPENRSGCRGRCWKRSRSGVSAARHAPRNRRDPRRRLRPRAWNAARTRAHPHDRKEGRGRATDPLRNDASSAHVQLADLTELPRCVSSMSSTSRDGQGRRGGAASASDRRDRHDVRRGAPAKVAAIRESSTPKRTTSCYPASNERPRRPQAGGGQ